MMSHTYTISNLLIGYDPKSKLLETPFSTKIEQGCLIALIGANGIGKSTLLKTLSGSMAALSGSLSIDGRELSSMSPAERAKHISIVSATEQKSNHFTVYESIAIGRYPHTNLFGQLPASDRKIIDASIEYLQLEPLKCKPTNQLSDGENQRVAIARALVQESPILFLDEPTSHLDYPNRIQLLQLLQSLAKKRISVIISSHEVDLCLRHCDTIWLFSQGKTITQYEPGKLSTHQLNQAFGCNIF